MRAQASSIRSRDHVALARINGYSTFGIVMLHILPYLLSYIFMVFILQTATGILVGGQHQPARARAVRLDLARQDLERGQDQRGR